MLAQEDLIHMIFITKTRLFKYTENFTTKKWKFLHKNSNIFFQISAKNIDCGYSLEPPRQGGSNEYPQYMFLSRNKKIIVYPCKPQFCYIKVGLKGVNIIWACFRDVHVLQGRQHLWRHICFFFCNQAPFENGSALLESKFFPLRTGPFS